MSIARTKQNKLSDGSVTFDVVMAIENSPKPVTFVCTCDGVADRLAGHINALYAEGHIVEVIVE